MAINHLEPHSTRFAKKKALVVGDIMVDRYTSGQAVKISPEAPIPVMTGVTERSVLGGAANVAHNIAALGGKATLCGVVGNDAVRADLLAMAQSAKIATTGIVVDKSRPTTLKHRFLADNIQLARFDTEDARDIKDSVEQELMRKIERLMPAYDVVILSDYAKGCLTEKICAAVITLAHKQGKKVIADIKPARYARFRGVDLITPNIEEARAISGLHELDAIGAQLMKLLASDVFVTRGGEGISVFGKKKIRHDVPGRTVQVFDVTGAGDTVTAVAALALASDMTLVEAAQLANAAGSLVVQRHGTAVVTAQDIDSVFSTHIESVSAVPKVWGKEQWLENNDKYCCKLLTLAKGYQCSLHYHKVKDEMFLITKGHVRLELGGKIHHLREGNFMRVPTGVQHRFLGIEDSLMIEISTHHEDDDSYRVPGEESRKADERDLRA